MQQRICIVDSVAHRCSVCANTADGAQVPRGQFRSELNAITLSNHRNRLRRSTALPGGMNSRGRESSIRQSLRGLYVAVPVSNKAFWVDDFSSGGSDLVDPSFRRDTSPREAQGRRSTTTVIAISA